MAFWHRAHSNKCFSQLLIPGLTPASLLESESGFETVTQLADTGERPSSHLLSMVVTVAIVSFLFYFVLKLNIVCLT